MNSLENNILEFVKLMEGGKTLQAIDLFYADNIRQIENNDPPILGKTRLRSMEEENIEKVKWFTIKTERLLVDQEKGVVMGELKIEFETKSNQRKCLLEAFVQEWEAEKISYQRFYYKEFVDAE